MRSQLLQAISSPWHHTRSTTQEFPVLVTIVLGDQRLYIVIRFGDRGNVLDEEGRDLLFIYLVFIPQERGAQN